MLKVFAHVCTQASIFLAQNLLLLSISKAKAMPDEKEGKPIFTQDSADMMYNFLSWSQAGSGFYSQAEKRQRQL